MEPRWNHANYAVPPARLPVVEACLDALFGWEKFVAKPTLLGYRLGADFNQGALYVRPAPPAAALDAALARIRVADPELDGALAGFQRLEADYADHVGVLLPSLAAWEACLARAADLERTRPEFAVRVVDVLRPGDGRAQTDYLYQAFVRVGVLGPLRNTFELQAVRGA
jgi:hypothetical protein